MRKVPAAFSVLALLTICACSSPQNEDPIPAKASAKASASIATEPTKQHAKPRVARHILLSSLQWDSFHALSSMHSGGGQVGIVAVSENLTRLVYETTSEAGSEKYTMEFPGRRLLDQRCADSDGGSLNGDSLNMTEFWIATCDADRTGGRVELYSDPSGKAEFANLTPIRTWDFPGELPVKTTWLPSGTAFLLNTEDASRIVHVARDAQGDYNTNVSTFYDAPASGTFHDEMPFAYFTGNVDGSISLNVIPDPNRFARTQAYRPTVTLYDDNQDLVADREEVPAPLPANYGLRPPAYFSTGLLVDGDTRIYAKHIADGRVVEARVGSEVLGSVTGTTNPRAIIHLSRPLVLGEKVHLYAPDTGAVCGEDPVDDVEEPRVAWPDHYDLSLQGSSFILTGIGFRPSDKVSIFTDKNDTLACSMTFVSEFEIHVATPSLGNSATLGDTSLMLVSPTNDPNDRRSSVFQIKNVP